VIALEEVADRARQVDSLSLCEKEWWTGHDSNLPSRQRFILEKMKFCLF
jgi:hypothetical protein